VQPQPLIIDYVARVVDAKMAGRSGVAHLDMGAGWGHLIQALRRILPGLKSSGCDYNPSHFPLTDVSIVHADFSRDTLPYADESFDLVTCTEVFEHLENFRHAVREVARVTRPGGLYIVSTPNVLSIKARFVYLTRGFFTYFDPLPLKNDPNIYPGERHISPIPYFYLAHAMLEAGFTNIEPHCGKRQKFSSIFGAVLAPVFRCFTAYSLRERRRRFFHLPEELETIAAQQNSWTVLTTRTLIVSARKGEPIKAAAKG
jgi:ubiquinone/menaquinone biosynthesis C-methylase UbiE